MTSRKQLFAVAAALAIATMSPLGALAAPNGFILGASCDGGTTELVNSDTAGIFGSNLVFSTTTSGPPGKSGYELTITGLKPVASPGIGSGWQDCTLTYFVPSDDTVVALSDIHVDLYFDNFSILGRTLASINPSAKLKRGQWVSYRFDNTNFAGQGRQNLLKRVVVYLQNDDFGTSKRISFGNIEVNHFAQGGLDGNSSDVKISTNDDGCQQLGPTGGQGGQLKNRFLSRPSRLRAPR